MQSFISEKCLLMSPRLSALLFRKLEYLLTPLNILKHCFQLIKVYILVASASI